MLLDNDQIQELAQASREHRQRCDWYAQLSKVFPVLIEVANAKREITEEIYREFWEEDNPVRRLEMCETLAVGAKQAQEIAEIIGERLGDYYAPVYHPRDSANPTQDQRAIEAVRYLEAAHQWTTEAAERFAAAQPRLAEQASRIRQSFEALRHWSKSA